MRRLILVSALILGVQAQSAFSAPTAKTVKPEVTSGPIFYMCVTMTIFGFFCPQFCDWASGPPNNVY